MGHTGGKRVDGLNDERRCTARGEGGEEHRGRWRRSANDYARGPRSKEVCGSTRAKAGGGRGKLEARWPERGPCTGAVVV